ncbi:MAG: lipoyl(octanoyl) transferase LipB [bacterium]|nr:lipoyl(octanoyl) transferase LipB [bacterium]
MALFVYLNRLRPSATPLDYGRYMRLQQKLRARRRECVLFCSHPPTITAGVQSRPESLQTDAARLSALGIHLEPVGRAGDYTAHEPGQCVIYPHLDLRRRQIGVPEYFNGLLECTSLALDRVWGVRVVTRKDAPGLYLAEDGAKLASIGIMFKSFFTSHGVAVNVGNDLSTFAHIHPCGYAGQRIASILNMGLDPDRLPEFLECWRDEFSKRILESVRS